MEDFLEVLLNIILLVAVAGLLICCAMALGLGDCIKKLWEVFISTKPKTGIDKEISEEEKEIEYLEKQKEKINKLHRLKRRKEELFEQVERHSE